MDGARERLSEQQFNRLVDYIAKTSCHLAPSCSSMQTACSVVAVELPPATVRTYHYLADPHSAQVFVSRFTMVKNRALRKGFPWVPSCVPLRAEVWLLSNREFPHSTRTRVQHVCSNRHTNSAGILYSTFSPDQKDKRYSFFKLQRKKSKWERNKWSAESCFCMLTMCRKHFFSMPSAEVVTVISIC